MSNHLVHYQGDTIPCNCDKGRDHAGVSALEEILHDFAVSLHEYANGRANGLVYGEQIGVAKQAIANLILEEQIKELETFLFNWRSLVVAGPRNYLENRLAELKNELSKGSDDAKGN